MSSSSGNTAIKDSSVAQFYDDAFAHIAQRAGSMDTFLEEFFSFLHRRTDFYVQFPPNPIGENSNGVTYKMGFPKGVAEQMVLRKFRQFPMKDYDEHESNYSSSSPRKSKLTTSKLTPSKASNATSSKRSGEEASLDLQKVQYTTEGKQLPIGNGGVGPNYYWTQSLRELTVYIDILDRDVNCKAVECFIKASTLHLNVNGTTLLSGDLEETIRPSESTWTLNKGNISESPQIIITLEKKRETWWKHIIVGHPEIDTTKVDSTKNINEYDDETQGVIRKLMFQQRQKLMGSPIQDEQTILENLLAEASDLPGSPFKTSDN